jgi:hypothetical protein
MTIYVKKKPSKKQPGVYHISADCPMVDLRTYETRARVPEGYVLCKRSGPCSKLN